MNGADGDDRIERCADARLAAGGAGVVLTMLSDGEAVAAAVDAAAEAIGSGTVWLQMSTIGIEGTERCRQRAEGAGAVFVVEGLAETLALAEGSGVEPRDFLADLAAAAARDAGLELPMLESIAARLDEGSRAHGDEDLAATYLVSSPNG